MQQTTNATNAIMQKITIENSWLSRSKTHFCSNPGILLMNPLLFNVLALAATMFLSGRPVCGTEKGSSTKCSRLIFSSVSELLPSGVIRQICTSRHFLSTQTTRRSDDRVRVCQVLFTDMIVAMMIR